MIKIDLTYTGDVLAGGSNATDATAAAVRADVTRAYSELYTKSGKGNDFLGWVDLPAEITPSQLEDIEQTAAKFRAKSEVFVCIGIGGSYLGTRAVEEALKPFFGGSRGTLGAIGTLGTLGTPEIIYAGHQLSEDYFAELMQYLDGKEYTICVISKSGTTTEPAIAFRILCEHLTAKYGVAQAAERIVAITDRERGALKGLADLRGYKTYVIPDDVGGRYSVLTPVGLFPLAVLGVDITALVQGAVEMRSRVKVATPDFDNCPCAQYVLLRNILYREGRKMELMVQYDLRFFYFIEWWKQLYGESE
ncbi:MAG: glucose-6-phosphate isomerase, partial [Bacteroidales bacterium]|nr:glucose-6-phosphate isomerase [Bacteroidales bacterium]